MNNIQKEKQVFMDGLFHIIPASLLRETPNVIFNNIPIVKDMDAIDHVIHSPLAVSPSIKNHAGKYYWYMHTDQEDNLFVVSGLRNVELYTPAHGIIEKFEITSTHIKHGDKILHEGAAIFGWSRGVFHHIQSGENGSRSLNFARHYNGFDINTNFNIYDVDTDSGRYEVVRPGFKDQPS